MKFLSFLLEHERGSKRVSRLPLECSMTERLRISAVFCDPGPEEHLLEVVTQQPDGTFCLLGRASKRSQRDDGVFFMEVVLEPLVVAGWHRLFLRVDGAGEPVQSTPMHVLGPRGTRARPHVGRARGAKDAARRKRA